MKNTTKSVISNFIDKQTQIRDIERLLTTKFQCNVRYDIRNRLANGLYSYGFKLHSISLNNLKNELIKIQKIIPQIKAIGFKSKRDLKYLRIWIDASQNNLK